MCDILDPTIARPQQRIDYVERPRNLRALRIGLIDTTKKNAEAVLRSIAGKLESAHGMTLEVLVHKHQRAPLYESQLRELKGRVDFAIVGVGD